MGGSRTEGKEAIFRVVHGDQSKLGRQNTPRWVSPRPARIRSDSPHASSGTTSTSGKIGAAGTAGKFVSDEVAQPIARRRCWSNSRRVAVGIEASGETAR